MYTEFGPAAVVKFGGCKHLLELAATAPRTGQLGGRLQPDNFFFLIASPSAPLGSNEWDLLRSLRSW